MKKHVLFPTLLLAIAALTSCGKTPVSNSAASVDSKTSTTVVAQTGRTLASIKTKFQSSGYVVTELTMGGVGALTAVKSLTESLTVLFFGSQALATENKPTWEASAATAGQTCKQDGGNIYFGTVAAISLYESI